MDFSFTGEQLAFRDAVRDLLAKECPPEVVRAELPPPDPDRPGQGVGAGARAGADAVARLWSSLAGMGVFGVAVPEAAGGLGMTEVDWVLLAEEAGYAAAPVRLVETMAVTAPWLATTGEADALARALEGTSEVTLVSDLAAATATMCGITDFGQAAAHGAAELAFDRAVLAAAAQLVGLTRRMLDLTVAYVSERKQFGAPIGSFQAVKHHLADARLQLEFAAPAVYAAAWAMATRHSDAPRDVSVAKALASDAARLTARKALQCHGAIGYTVEYDLHLYFRRAHTLAAAWGDAAWHRDRIAVALGV